MPKSLIDSIIVVGDLGEIKIYRVKEELAISLKDDAQVSHKHHKGKLIERLTLNLIKAADFIDAHKKISEEVTDKVGHFEGRFGGESGEPHNLKLEIERRVIKEEAKFINQTLLENDFKKWHLAFPKEHYKELIDHLDYRLKDKLDKVVPEDLTKMKEDKVLSYFS
ncbi:MAG: host attachment protein [Epsilonproteobacteria bacterium]|nr:host attachment protein [Campylobacterota bacterium]